MTATVRKNNESLKSVTLKQLAQKINAELVGGDPQALVFGAASLEEAQEGEVSFLSNPKYLPQLKTTKATAVVVSKETVCEGKALLRVDHPSRAFTHVIGWWQVPSQDLQKSGVHPQAFVHASASLGQNVWVGPFVVIEEGAVIGDGTQIAPQCFVGANSKIGSQVVLYPQVVIRENSQIGNRVMIHSGTVVGSDGFGYETLEGKHIKIPQTGMVVIEDDVEIGSNVSIDRARFGKTWIKKGTKIDNLVQIAHNVVIGEHSLVLSQVGVSGSSKVGKGVILAGQVGLVGHLSLGDGVIVGAGAGVTKSWPDGSIILGSPAKPIGEQKRLLAFMNRLPDLFKDVAEIKKRLLGK